uniref:PolyU-specific endoribonuclease-B n=1 Tax=Rhizophora mucronata TaxID=61149 RepID=A0A2P2JL91_RHIMU
MEGLIKGLMDVALGHGGDHVDESRDERSRSTWAQVVSGEQDNDDPRHGYGQHDRRNQWNAENEGRNEEWQSEGSRPSRRPQKGYVEESNDGWETVDRRHPKKPHKVQMDHWHGYKRPPSEQQYSDDVEEDANLVPSEEELADLSKACNRLWELDLNRLIPGKHYEIDVGEGKKVHDKEDAAQGSLFSWLSEDVLRKPTFSRFCSLLDNYNPNEGYKEVITSEERQEQVAFIEEISRTAPIKYLHNYLASKGILSRDKQDFKRMLMNLWFDLYGRGGTYGSSSAFEHVFVGEIKHCDEVEVSGFHNWLQFYLEEAKGTVDYQGYIFPRYRRNIPDSETQLLTIQFEWNGALKSVSSTLVGVSPEFELALYTLCFFVGGQESYVELGPYRVNIKCYRFGDRMGSAFPVAE